MNSSFRCWAEINVEAIRSNLETIRSFVPAGVRVIAVVKADAYGHGLLKVARELDRNVDLFGVASLAEGRAIRSTGAQAPVLILGPALPEERQAIVDEAFIPTVSNLQEAIGFAKCVPAGERIPVHFAIDTGMGRIGWSEEEAEQMLAAMEAMPRLRMAAFSSHFPVADEDEAYTVGQLERFRSIASRLRLGEQPAAILNSAGVMRWGCQARSGDLVRVGLTVYGISPLSEFQAKFQPAMTLKTRVVLVRSLGPGRSISYGRTFVTPGRMKVATLCAGYGDGFDRHLSGQETDVLIKGRRCRLLGRVTMDQVMVDVTHLEGVEPGDEVVLIGRQGDQEILANELASKAGTIAWEIFTGITNRVVRVHLDGTRVGGSAYGRVGAERIGGSA
jgi:alanine racemase